MLAEKVRRSVADAVAGEDVVAVAFSGGLDSSVIVECAMAHAKVVACSCHSSGSLDSTRVAKGAKLLGVGLATTEITAEGVANELSRVDLPFQPTLMDRSLWCLYSLVSQCAQTAGAKVMLLGQLADELFGGYAKYLDALDQRGEEAARSMMETDAKAYAARGRARDFAACSRWVEPRLPFEAADIVHYAGALPVSYKIRGGVRKAILRRAALSLGVPKELAEAPKKAAQYSSGIQKLVSAGF